MSSFPLPDNIADNFTVQNPWDGRFEAECASCGASDKGSEPNVYDFCMNHACDVTPDEPTPDEPIRVSVSATDTGDKPLNVIALCVNALASLDPNEQKGVITYLHERYIG